MRISIGIENENEIASARGQEIGDIDAARAISCALLLITLIMRWFASRHLHLHESIGSICIGRGSHLASWRSLGHRA